ncbi:MAG TPA: DUF742 domain-containing protein [Pseudonocardia sp.]|nr:DUF742 domain-containing protein [Pseudonocardia sp.]
MSHDPGSAGLGGQSRPSGSAGRVVPVFAVTGGRTRSTGSDLPVESLVTLTEQASLGGDLQMEYRIIVQLAERPVSLVEIGAALRVPVGVARVLVSDLAEAGYLEVHVPPAAADGTGGGPAPAILERLLEGLRAR